MSLSSEAAPSKTALADAAGPPRPWAGYLVSLAMVGLATWAAVLANQLLGASNLSLVFVLPVVIAAVNFGWGPAIVAAVAGVAAFNFFLIPPLYTFRVAEAANLWALGLLAVVAAIVSAVAAQSRQRAVEAAQRADQALALHALARGLAGAADRKAIAIAAAEALARLFRIPAAVLVANDDTLEAAALAGGATLTAADEEAARWAAATRMATRADAYPIEEAAYDFWPVATPAGRRAAVGLRFNPREGRPAEPERLVEIVTGYLAVALARDDYAALALNTQVEVARERLKAELLAAVSHDLKTPLSTVLFTLQSLQKFADAHDAATRQQLLTLAETETARLNGMVANLLDMSRLDEGAVVVQPKTVPPTEIARGAVERVTAALAGRKLVQEIPQGAPALLADPALAETALANVLENAGKYAPEGSTIVLKFSRADGFGVFEVLDEGGGFPGAIEPMFEKFTRGVEGDGRPPGTGLGLAIARGFLEAQGGKVVAANRLEGPGARVRLVLPLAAKEAVPA